MTEYKRLGDYIREVSNREHEGDATLIPSEMVRRCKKTVRSKQ